MRHLRPIRALPFLSALGVVAMGGALAPLYAQGALFGARDVAQERFVLVAAPIGDGTRAQLNIYEQITNRRPCFAVSGANPARVDPLLGTFDFTGICTRYIDANGYSLRVGDNDLATVYRISVVRSGNDNILLATPHRGKTGPEMILARTNGHAAGFLQFTPEPGWRLMRRHFGTRALGHVYIYRDNWPGETTAAPAGSGAPGGTAPGSTAPAPAGRGTPGATTPQPTTPAARPTSAPAVPGSSAPRSTTPSTTAPRTAVPGATAPGTTAPATTGPSTTAPRTTVPRPSSPAGAAAPTGSAPATGATRTAVPLSPPPVVPPAPTSAPRTR
ncbi:MULTISPECIES: DUF3747 domain-containing protein [Synechococcales]|uniref:DUF3747 domain-containing protein n=1 Tax=Synechococcus sp. CS-1333 TaxID=2848638 RepID=UPI00223B61D7|nr:DUF3747 domain-containing protein [Synechococcus sp. CS-1333]MCT0210458.1 DUF3747 domain-containing protein [Synechococcus sp. CS-1333]